MHLDKLFELLQGKEIYILNESKSLTTYLDVLQRIEQKNKYNKEVR